MRKIRIVEAAVSGTVFFVVSDDPGLEVSDDDLRALTLEILRERDPEDLIDLSEVILDSGQLPQGETVYVSSSLKVDNKPFGWVEHFINDYMVEDLESTDDWELALARYSFDLEFFEEAFSHPSSFPRVEGDNRTDYEIMRFVIDNFDKAVTLGADDPIRTRLNYYYLRFPRLRGALVDYSNARK
jgi:hypothetical protein